MFVAETYRVSFRSYTLSLSKGACRRAYGSTGSPCMFGRSHVCLGGHMYVLEFTMHIIEVNCAPIIITD